MLSTRVAPSRRNLGTTKNPCCSRPITVSDTPSVPRRCEVVTNGSAKRILSREPSSTLAQRFSVPSAASPKFPGCCSVFGPQRPNISRASEPSLACTSGASGTSLPPRCSDASCAPAVPAASPTRRQSDLGSIIVVHSVFADLSRLLGARAAERLLQAFGCAKEACLGLPPDQAKLRWLEPPHVALEVCRGALLQACQRLHADRSNGDRRDRAGLDP